MRTRSVGERKHERVMRCKWSPSHCCAACFPILSHTQFFIPLACLQSRWWWWGVFIRCLSPHLLLEMQHIHRLCISWISGVDTSPSLDLMWKLTSYHCRYPRVILFFLSALLGFGVDFGPRSSLHPCFSFPYFAPVVCFALDRITQS